MLVDDAIKPEQPPVFCQGNHCGRQAYAYIEANDVVVLLCEPCIATVADACTILGIQWKVFDPHSGPLKPKELDTEARLALLPDADDEHHYSLIKGRRQIYDGGSFELNPRDEQAAIACCNCGLVHILDAALLDYSRTLRITLRRDNELTARWRAYRDEQRGARTPAGTEEEAGSGADAGPQTVEAAEEVEGRDTGRAGRSAVAGPLEDSGRVD